MSQASPKVGVQDLQKICDTITAFYRERMSAGRSAPEAYGDSLFYWCSYVESADKYKPSFPAAVAQVKGLKGRNTQRNRHCLDMFYSFPCQQLAHSGTDSASDTEKRTAQAVVR